MMHFLPPPRIGPPKTRDPRQYLMAKSEQAAPVADVWGAAPRDALVCVFLHFGGDAAALCACVCVCTTWAAAAGSAELWRSVDLRAVRARAGNKAANKVKALLARSRGGLRALTLDGVARVGDDVLDALAPLLSPALQQLSLVGCHRISVEELLRKLSGAQLSRLRVAGIAPVTQNSQGPLRDHVAALASLTRDGDMDVDAICTHSVNWHNAGGSSCRRLFNSADCDTCDVCLEGFCKRNGFQQRHARSCRRCGSRFCRECFDDAPDDELAFLKGHQCKVCKKALCGECTRNLALAQSTRSVVQHFTCGMCDMDGRPADVCRDCAFRKNGQWPVYDWRQGFVCSSGVPSGGVGLTKSQAYQDILMRDDDDGCCAYLCSDCCDRAYGCCGPARGLLARCFAPQSVSDRLTLLGSRECRRRFCFMCRYNEKYLRPVGRDEDEFRCTLCAPKRWFQRK